MKYKFIINQNANTGKIIKIIPDILELLKSRFSDYDYNITKSLDEVPEVLSDSDKYDVIVAVGGDGTLNGILNNTITKNKVLGLIPVGTGNDFPLMINIPHDIVKSVDILQKHKINEVDVGFLSTEKYKKYFLNAIGIGFDAKVGYHTNQIKFIDGGLNKYILSMLYSVFAYKAHNIKIEMENGENLLKKVFLITIGNGKRTGGGFLLTPDAQINDGLLDVCLVDDVSILRVLTVFPKVLKGLHTTIPEVTMYKTKKINVISEDEVYLHFDGETPDMVKNIQIEILPQKQKIITNI